MAEQRNTYKLKDGRETDNTYLEGQYVCKFCGSPEVEYQQSVDDASCGACGRWQNEASDTVSTKG